MVQRYRIGAPWFGGALDFLDRLCLVSFLHAGHGVTLYCYGEAPPVPDGIDVADANEVLPASAFASRTPGGTLAPKSDRFRYRLLSAQDDIIWVDMATCCVAPFVPQQGYFCGWETTQAIGNGGLALPADSETLRELIAFTSDEHAVAEWLPDEEKARHQADAQDRERHNHWASWGPRALTYYLHKTGEIRHALPREALYPFSQSDIGAILEADNSADARITPETVAIPLFSRHLRARLAPETSAPPPSSLLGRLLCKHGILSD